MRILCFSDLHAQFRAFPPDRMPEADVCLFAGDLTNLSMRGEARGSGEIGRAREWLAAMGERQPVFWITGNHDIGMNNFTFGAIPNCIGIERRSVRPDVLNNATVHGIDLSPCFNVPGLKLVWDRMTDSKSLDLGAFSVLPAASILLSHCPPKGVLDGDGFGSPGLLAYIEQCRPRLVVCGHIHECGGKWSIVGETLVVNCAQMPMIVDWSPGSGQMPEVLDPLIDPESEN